MFLQVFDVLLTHHSSDIVGVADVAFCSVCPNGIVLIAKHFRRICGPLPEIEEWCQIALTVILLWYVIARHGLVKESAIFASDFSLEIHGGRDSVFC
jgi:AP-3 complex subunit beta